MKTINTLSFCQSKSTHQTLAEGDCYRLIFEMAFQFIGLLDAEGAMLVVNQSALAWVRSSREAVVGLKVWDTPWWINACDAVLERLKAAVDSAGKGEFIRYDVTLPSIDGLEHTFDFSLMPIADDTGQVVMLVAEGRNITEKKQLEQELRETNLKLQLAQEQARQLAITDELTGLYNRRGFYIMAEQQKQIALRSSARGLLMFVDVDDLKRVNDEYGHDVGDELIIGAARVLTRTFRTGDLVSRFGGDEFAVLALLSTGDSTATFTNRLAFHLDAFNNDTKLRMILQMSLGTREFEWTDNIGFESLVAQADAHMYEQKRKRKRQSY